MSSSAMARAVMLFGIGLCMVSGGLLIRNGLQAHAAGGSASTADAALAPAASARARQPMARHGMSRGCGCHRASAAKRAGGSVERWRRLRSTDPMRMANQDRPLPLPGASGA